MRNDHDRLIAAANDDRQRDRLDEARQTLVELVQRSRTSGGAPLAEALAHLGRIERDLHREQAALALYHEAADIWKTIGQTRRLAHALRHIGDIHLDANRLDQADTFLSEALALHRDDPRTPALELANSIRPLAILRHKTGDAREARQLLKEAIDLYLKVGVAEGAKECTARLRELGPS